MPAERKRKQKVDDDEGGICICEVLDDSILKSVDTLRRSPRTRARLVQVLSILLGLWSCRVLWRKRVVSDPVLSSVLQVFLTLLAIDVALSFIVTLYLVAPKNVPFLKEKGKSSISFYFCTRLQFRLSRYDTGGAARKTDLPLQKM
mmetsp:Transcript_35688/g.93021  ORF Transcript_35688/g.93021 Transcript_35688/m.93021 type:complete len:146 (-) Transcript_35688:1055-1492(-)